MEQQPKIRQYTKVAKAVLHALWSGEYHNTVRQVEQGLPLIPLFVQPVAEKEAA